MVAAVSTLVGDPMQLDLVTDMLFSISKPERAKMHFSREFLRAQVEHVLDWLDEEPAPPPAAPVTPASKPAPAAGWAGRARRRC